MEVKNIHIKGIPNEEFNDNEYLENYVEELKANGVNVVISTLDDMINWGRSNSIWPLIFATSCWYRVYGISCCASRYFPFRYGGYP